MNKNDNKLLLFDIPEVKISYNQNANQSQNKSALIWTLNFSIYSQIKLDWLKEVINLSVLHHFVPISLRLRWLADSQCLYSVSPDIH